MNPVEVRMDFITDTHLYYEAKLITRDEQIKKAGIVSVVWWGHGGCKTHEKIYKLIINSPYEEPKQYWEYIRDTWEFVSQECRRPAGYIVASVTMVGARSLVVAQICANDTSRGNASKPIFISDTIEIWRCLQSISILHPSCSKIFQTGRSLFLYLP